MLEVNRTLEAQNIEQVAKNNNTALSRAVYRAFLSYQRMEKNRYLLLESQEFSSIIDIPQMPVKYDSTYEKEFFSRIHA